MPLLTKKTKSIFFFQHFFKASNSFLLSFLLCGIFAFSFNSAYAQLTISDAGQTGASGTNWRIIGGNPLILDVTGQANVHSSVITQWMNQGYDFIVNNHSVGTYINASITETSSGERSLTFKDISYIKVGAGVSITSSTGKLNIILWADADYSQGGTVSDFIYCNSGTSFNSNGGKIVMAGGRDNGANGGVSGDGIPDEFAWNGSNDVTVGASTCGGLFLGTRNSGGTLVSLISNGGDIILRGASSDNNGLPGISSQVNLKIDAGAGKVIMHGKSSKANGLELGPFQTPTIAINSSSTNIPAISIKGETNAATKDGLWIGNIATGNILIQSTAPTGGGIFLEGVSSSNNGLACAISGSNQVTQILSQSGTITLSGKGKTDASILLYGDLYIGNRKDATNVQGVAPAVTSSSADIVVLGNDLIKLSNTSGKNTHFNTSGNLAIKAYSPSFIGAIGQTGNLNLGPDINNITLGEPGVSYSQTIDKALTVKGNISVYGEELSINANLTSINNKDIDLHGNVLSIAGSSILSSGGKLIIQPLTSPTTIGLAGGAGTLQVSETNFNSNFADGFSEIIIGNNGSGNITLGSALTTRSNLRLITSYNIVLNDILTIGNNNLWLTGSAINPAPGKYVKTNGTGKLFRYINNNSAMLFPVGTDYSNPVTITNHIGVADEFYATVSPGVYTNGSSSGTSVSFYPRVDVTWNIGNSTSSTGTGNVDLYFAWDAANESGMLNLPRLIHYKSNTWTQTYGTPTFDLGARTLTYSGYTGSFSPFGIAETEQVLPVTWISFNAQKTGNSIFLDWKVASEQGNSHYDIERSGDGSSFVNIGRVLSQSQQHGYYYTDNQPLTSISFYRIKQVDLDGRSSYSNIAKISMEGARGYSIIAVPGSHQLKINVPSTGTSSLNLIIYDGIGRQILRRQIQPGYSVVNTGHLQPGAVYLVTLTTDDQVLYSTRFVN